MSDMVEGRKCDNPPAFPCETDGNENGFQSGAHLWTYPGMTLRDYVATQALAVISNSSSPAEHAFFAYELADAMLAARKEQQP